MSSDQVILITGATGGLGLATAKALRDSATGPTTIILTSRDGAKGQASVDRDLVESQSKKAKIVVKQLLLDDDEDVQRFSQEITKEFGRIDVLINNAGEFSFCDCNDPCLCIAVHVDFSIGQGEGKISVREAFNKSCNTNIASTYLLTHALIPLLLASESPRLVFVSTGLSSMEDTLNAKYPLDKPTEHTGWPKPYIFNVLTYRSSKAGLNMMALDWARTLKNDGVKVFILDPGLLATNLGGMDPKKAAEMGAADPSVGGEFVRDVAIGRWDHAEGRLLNKDGILPW